jgi:L-lactate dehydrogenase complex protein LldG
MNSTRDKMLLQLRRQLVPDVALPEVIEGSWIQYDQPLKTLSEVLKSVGGSCTHVQNVSEIDALLSQIPQWQTAKRVFSSVEGLSGNVRLDDIDDPHKLEDLDFVIYPGQFAVAENGAIWITDEQLKHRVIFFITQYLVLVLSQRDVVHNMHEAYARAIPPQPGFGLFLSGPSKTADIEQSLVIGAHGCRQLQVFLLP